jgi:hypothetical protein
VVAGVTYLYSISSLFIIIYMSRCIHVCLGRVERDIARIVKGRNLGEEVGDALDALVQLFGRKIGPKFDWPQKHRDAFAQLFGSEEDEEVEDESVEEEEELCGFVDIQAALLTPTPPARWQQAGSIARKIPKQRRTATKPRNQGKQGKMGKRGETEKRKGGGPTPVKPVKQGTQGATDKRKRGKQKQVKPVNKGKQGGAEKRKRGRPKQLKPTKQGKQGKKGEKKKGKGGRPKNQQYERMLAMRKERDTLQNEGKHCAFEAGDVIFVKVIHFFLVHHKLFTSVSCAGLAWRGPAVLDCQGADGPRRPSRCESQILHQQPQIGVGAVHPPARPRRSHLRRPVRQDPRGCFYSCPRS